MCHVSNISPARRRHRPTYLAPSRSIPPPLLWDGTIANSTTTAATIAIIAGDDDDSVVLGEDMLATTTAAATTTTTTTTAASTTTTTNTTNTPNTTDDHSLHHHQEERIIITFRKVLIALFRSLLDLMLLISIVIVSFFLYDVEINIVKPGESARSTDLLGSRVILRNELQATISTDDTTTASTSTSITSSRIASIV
eukprot:CAMPEP_0202449750 /NCGR_PEP_ID=MMETSP1360-20130828/8464_1 /ASSEMBLY_ACC=CAM_ASM_000848 /TAXON_ID=515479 /ORGANISM="Licmophora paradoxa, Strain CCMP2313" /LENGTH=196 /DNA_ID=CAMNT_0049067783 /DNA_START=62 /DNA_END=652 /DNA_ORIENTATION=+